MKKFLSALLSAVIGASVAIVPPANVTAENDRIDSITILGDSIASGYGLEKNEHNYGEIIGDYLNCEVQNYAVPGDTTFDLINVLNDLSDEQKKFIADSEVVVISVGGNDMMNQGAKNVLDFAVKKGLLKEGYTKDDIPAEPSISDLRTYVDIDGLKSYAKKDGTLLEFIRLLGEISGNLCSESQGNDGYIKNVMIPNINTSVSKIREINPDARIIIQTVYNPVQLEPEYLLNNFSTAERTLIGILRLKFRDILKNFRTALGDVEGVEIVDIFNEFTSLPADADETVVYGNCYYFTDIQLDDDNKDFHPNQRGHLAIAAKILDTIGELHDDDKNGLMTRVYNSLKIINSDIIYPHIALDTYKKVAGNLMMGDVDFNMVINGSDATTALREYTNINSGDPTMFSNMQKQCADIDKDDIISGSDAQRILNYYTYLSSGGTLSMEEYIENKQ